MAQPDDFTPYSSLWATFNSWSDERKAKVFAQVMAAIKDLPMSSVANVLDGMAAPLKEYVWKEWSKTTDLSGASLTDIEDVQITEPPSAIYSIIQSWLKQVDLSKYDLHQIRKCASMLRGEDVGKLWNRWLAHADLRHVNLVQFAKAVSELSPELQKVCIDGFVKHAPNMNAYGWKEREKVKTYLSMWAIQNSSYLSENGIGTQPKFRTGIAVKIMGQPYGTRIEAVFNHNGEWLYRLRDEGRYFRENELKAI